MGEWLPSSSLGAGGRPLVAPSPGSTGQPPERHRGRTRTTSSSSSMNSQANLELLFFLFFRRPQPHAADGDARAGVRGTSSAPGLADDLPRQPGLLLPHLLLVGSFKPVPLECFLLVGPETLHRKEFCIAIPILQTRKLPDCHFPKAVFLARSLEIKSRANSCAVEESVPTGQIQQRG